VSRGRQVAIDGGRRDEEEKEEAKSSLDRVGSDDALVVAVRPGAGDLTASSQKVSAERLDKASWREGRTPRREPERCTPRSRESHPRCARHEPPEPCPCRL
jgi:hypothetical protein